MLQPNWGQVFFVVGLFVGVFVIPFLSCAEVI